VGEEIPCDQDESAAVCECRRPSNGGTGGTGGSGGGDCVPFSNVAGVWEEVYTCVTSTTCEEDVPITVQLTQTSKDVDWQVTAGIDEGSTYSGELCGTSFKWEATGTTPDETGCWEFNQAAFAFNKRSLGPGFVCVGIGSKGAGSDPDPEGILPTCSDLQRPGIDYGTCPQAPPAGPAE
jgi:hypothetical protein